MAIHLHMDGEQHGPFTADELSTLWKLGEVGAEAFFWYRGMKAWSPVVNFRPYDPAVQTGSRLHDEGASRRPVVLGKAASTR